MKISPKKPIRVISPSETLSGIGVNFLPNGWLSPIRSYSWLYSMLEKIRTEKRRSVLDTDIAVRLDCLLDYITTQCSRMSNPIPHCDYANEGSTSNGPLCTSSPFTKDLLGPKHYKLRMRELIFQTVEHTVDGDRSFLSRAAFSTLSPIEDAARDAMLEQFAVCIPNLVQKYLKFREVAQDRPLRNRRKERDDSSSEENEMGDDHYESESGSGTKEESSVDEINARFSSFLKELWAMTVGTVPYDSLTKVKKHFDSRAIGNRSLLLKILWQNELCLINQDPDFMLRLKHICEEIKRMGGSDLNVSVEKLRQYLRGYANLSLINTDYKMNFSASPFIVQALGVFVWMPRPLEVRQALIKLEFRMITRKDFTAWVKQTCREWKTQSDNFNANRDPIFSGAIFSSSTQHH